MSRLAVALALTWGGAVAIVAALAGPADAALTAGLLLGVAAVTTPTARLAAGGGSRRTLDRQLALGVAVPAVQMALVSCVFAAVMFLSTHDAILIVLVSACAGVLSLLTGRMVTDRLASDVRAIRDGLVDVGGGRRDVAVRADGSRELVELADSANTMAERLDAAERARSGLVVAISHDLRTPLTSLRLVTEALEDDILAPEERRQYLERMQLHIDALSTLIDDLFELSRLEAGDRSWTMGAVDLPSLADETVEAMRAEALAKRIAVVSEVPEQLPPAHANPEKLQRVLFNLLHNAIRHTPEDGRVTLRAELAGEQIEVEVADTGPGIASADRPLVFEAFRQGRDRVARGGSGAGLGLAISRAIVEAHAGRIWLEDGERGARVRFSLPLATSP